MLHKHTPFRLTQRFIISSKLHVAIEIDHQEVFSTNLQKKKIIIKQTLLFFRSPKYYKIRITIKL